MRANFILVVVAASVISLTAQSPVAFEVASVKPAALDSAGPTRAIQLFMPNSLRLTNITLKSLIQTAYGVQDYQISGTSGWMDSSAYDVEAKSATTVTREQELSMLQALLAERFKLKVHRATQDGNVYALAVAKSGLKIKLAADPAGGARGGANGRLIGKRSMPQLATLLSGILRRPVIDQTGLAGVYEFTLEWTPEVGQTGPDATPPAPANPGAPSIFTAVQEQLGLKLDSARAPIDLVIVDGAEKPSEN